jgi:hypothetical protein
MKLSEHKIKNNQTLMMKEISGYLEKHTKEMCSAIEELKYSFEEEMNSVDGKNNLN